MCGYSIWSSDCLAIYKKEFPTQTPESLKKRKDEGVSSGAAAEFRVIGKLRNKSRGADPASVFLKMTSVRKFEGTFPYF